MPTNRELMATIRVLVVEDEVIVAKIIAIQLKQLGYIVLDTASSGAAAIAKALETKPDLVLMDIVLKGEMDGVTAATHIRYQMDVPIIYLTAYADDNTLQRAKLTQPFGYITKPFTANDLRVAVEIGMFKHQVAQELQDNRDQLATLLRSMSDAVIATDAQGAITFMNPAAEVLTGWPQAEALGKASSEILQLINEVTGVPVINPVLRVLQEQQAVGLDRFMALVNREGQHIPIGDTASPLKRPSGEVIGAVVVFWDLSDRRQTEVLAEALEKEKELNYLKSQFVSTVSHEFRTPLAIIRTATELLEKRQGISDAKKNSYLQRIKTSVRTMNQLMEDVLLMGQAEASRLVCTLAPLDLEEFCRSLVEEYVIIEEKHIEEKHHKIIFSCQGECSDAWMDGKLLRYILTNLLSNAIKYTQANTAIQLRLIIDITKQVATFQVQDQGIGIPDVDQPRLFDSFFRATNVGSVQGTGLGLAIVKRCVEAHSGHINVVSQVGVGTTVTVTLPLSLSTSD
jgi:PAS domain S-box-containing protein